MQKPSVDVQKLDIMGDQVDDLAGRPRWKSLCRVPGRCDFLGVDWSSQCKKLAESAFFSRHLNRGVITTDQGDREMIGLESKYLRCGSPALTLTASNLRFARHFWGSSTLNVVTNTTARSELQRQ